MLEVHAANEKLILPKSIITIGAFDGVHRGHQKVIRETVRESAIEGVQSVVYTFDPPPRAYFQNAHILTSVKEKIQRFKRLGVDYVVIASFDESYTKRSPESFINELKRLNPKSIRVGEDFRFGKSRKGDVDLLKKHFLVQPIHTVYCTKGTRISSTRIRELMLEGEIQQTEPLLGW